MRGPPCSPTPTTSALRSYDGTAYVEEMDVLTDHGRRGLGGRLLEAVCTWAREQGHPAVTLSTFRDVPWNGPFYRDTGSPTSRPRTGRPACTSSVSRRPSTGYGPKRGCSCAATSAGRDRPREGDAERPDGPHATGPSVVAAARRGAAVADPSPRPAVGTPAATWYRTGGGSGSRGLISPQGKP